MKNEVSTIQIPDFNNHLFRCSALGKLMSGVSFGLTPNQEIEFQKLDLRYKGEGNPLTEKMKARHGELLQKKTALPTLSKGVQTFLEQEFREAVFNRRPEIFGKQLDKGNYNEEDSITLISRRLKFPFFKNEDSFSNEFIKGTPDNVQGKVRDLKTSWDLYSFPLYDRTLPNSDYEWQVLGYMWLTGLQETAEVIFALTDTPDHLVQDEKWRFKRMFNAIDLTAEQESEIEHFHCYEDIPDILKTRIFYVDWQEDKIKDLKKQIKLAREYLVKLGEELQERLDAERIAFRK